MMVSKVAGSYAVFMGASMISMWSVLIGTGEVQEIESEQIRISFHLAGEFLTAAALIIGGVGLYLDLRWGFNLYLVSMGMLTYTLVVSPGYYGQDGQYAFVAMFVAFMAVTVVLIAYSLKNENLFRSHRSEERP